MEIKECRQVLRDNKGIHLAIKTILKEIGEDPEREGLKDTPFRVAKAWEEWAGGYGFEPKDVLNRQFTESCGIVIEGPISFYSHCEHHMAPFFGTVYISYVPNQYVTGLDKLVKLVEIYARRLQIQERMTQQIADGLYNNLECLGVMVVVDAKHLCVSSRETKNDTTRTITSEVRGIFKTNASTRQEVLDLISIAKGE
jgi:GTP cyclohydrolase I